MNAFFQLTPDAVLDSVERALQKEFPGARSTGRSLALNSLENRVFDIELEDDSHVVAKFYRPNRWTKTQILEEHGFLAALKRAEIPVIAPFTLSNGSTLDTSEHEIHFAIFPKVRGRILDELSDSKLETLGRYTARIHAVGRAYPAKARLRLSTAEWGKKSLDFLLKSQRIDMTYESRYTRVVNAILAASEPMLARASSFLVHGDCHLGNTLWEGESPFFLDFDDAMIAPAVQDIWMIVRGRDENAERDREILLNAYQTIADFDYSELALIEPLRALRMIHYSAWVAKRWDDPSFKRVFPDFATPRYWEEEIEALQEILELIETPA